MNAKISRFPALILTVISLAACTPATGSYGSSDSSSSDAILNPASSSSTYPELSATCTSTTQCGTDQYCTTEDGACESSCAPGAEACIQVCAGKCRATSCKPYVCPDGTTAASCSEDGHVINYFADPCLTHQGSSSSAQ